MDKTSVMFSILGLVKVLVNKYNRRDYIKCTTVTTIEYISTDDRYLKPIIIWPASTYRSNQTTFPIPGQQYTYSESRYTDSVISFEQLRRIFDPETKEQANRKRRILICDNFTIYETLEILEFCFKNNILLCYLFSYTFYKLQPCDIIAFVSLKAVYCDQVDRLE